MAGLQYEQKNPKEILVSASQIADHSTVFLNEYYDTLWRAEYLSPEGKRTLLERNTDVKYANAWKAGDVDPQGKVYIYYLPVKLLSVGIVISTVVLILTFLGTIYSVRRKDNLQ